MRRRRRARRRARFGLDPDDDAGRDDRVAAPPIEAPALAPRSGVLGALALAADIGG
jgi:hypothetical protein